MRGKNFKAYELGKISLSCSVLPQCGYGQSSITNTREYKRKEIGGQRSQSTKGMFIYKSLPFREGFSCGKTGAFFGMVGRINTS